MFSKMIAWSLILSSMFCIAQATAQAWGSLVWQETFTGSSLNSSTWNTFFTSNNSSNWPWNYVSGQPLPSSSESTEYNLDYDLASNILVNNMLGLKASLGSSAAGYTWTGSVISSMPDPQFAKTTGYTFEDKYIEVKAQMPWSANGAWPAIWFLAAPGSSGAEIDLHEGGFLDHGVYPDDVMACNLHTSGNTQTLIDTGVGLSAGFHRYGMAYKQGTYIKFYFDDGLVATYTKNVPKGSYFIIINNSMGASSAAGWHSKVNADTPSTLWMTVKSISVYNLQ
ncbi:MAG: family 16 glycosylhydrolase [Capsulimonadaceae bacterium]|nr:family 16 glycosylhydrolase [Capsulimonadaceae bacterium]